MLKAFIFDLDGTLIDSLADIAGCINRMLEARGYPPCHDTGVFRQMVGDGMEKLVERALPEGARTEELIRVCTEEYRAFYDTHWQDQTRPYDQISETLAALKDRGIKVGVISNKAHRFTVPMTEHFFGAGLFDVILGQRPDVPRKPAPDGGLEAAALLGLRPEECAYVGDSGIDMAFAQSAGLYGIGVDWGFRTVQELTEHGARIIISQPGELLEILDKSR
ncbi:MAG TPA: HAD family hydrolase [Prosthecobacter sp.]